MSILSRARVAIRSTSRNPRAVADAAAAGAAAANRQAAPRNRRLKWYSDDERRMVVPPAATTAPGIVASGANENGEPDGRRFASAALVGLPNAGKSTLMNSLVGRRVAAVSRKVNTTQRRVVGAMTEGLCQVAFFDCPGVLPHTEVTGGLSASRRAILTEGWRAADEADLCFLVVDGAVRKPETWSRVARIAEQLSKSRTAVGKSVGLIITKSDLRQPSTCPLGTVDRIEELDSTLPGGFSNTFLVSALRHRGIQQFRTNLFESCQAGDWLYTAGTASGDPPVDQVQEILREKFLHRVHDEIPYRIEYETESWATSPKGVLRIAQCIRVPRERHISIVIGRGGETIDWIRQTAQVDIAAALGQKVELFLRVASHHR